jgi:hypothetical protein
MTHRLGDDFEERLRAELDRSRPPTPRPERARFAQPQLGFRRFGRLQLAVAMAGALAVLTVVAASAASGTDPATWPQRAVTTVESVAHVGESVASPSPEKVPQTQSRPPAQSQPSKSQTSLPGSQGTEPSDGSRTDQKESPEASPKQSRVRPSPSPSPNSDDHHSSSRWDARSQNWGSD